MIELRPYIAQQELLGLVSCNVMQFISHDKMYSFQLFAIRLTCTCSLILSVLVLGVVFGSIISLLFCIFSLVGFFIFSLVGITSPQPFCHLDWTSNEPYVSKFFSLALVCVCDTLRF